MFVFGEIGPQPRSRCDLFCSLLICIIDGSNTKVRAHRRLGHEGYFVSPSAVLLQYRSIHDVEVKSSGSGGSGGNSSAEFYLRSMDCIKFLREWAIVFFA
jgi:hypothetical protein